VQVKDAPPDPRFAAIKDTPHLLHMFDSQLDDVELLRLLELELSFLLLLLSLEREELL
jgi:hypothetical protein